jgi:hypothetical protein
MPLADGVYSITNFNTKNCVTAPEEVGAFLAGQKYEGSFAQQASLFHYSVLVKVVLTVRCS